MKLFYRGTILILFTGSCEAAMATYISLLRFTEKGVQHLKQSPGRASAFKAAGKKLGIKVKEAYWTLGENDGVLIFEAPDDETATAAMLHLSSLDNVHTRTCRAFSASEIKSILDKMPG